MERAVRDGEREETFLLCVGVWRWRDEVRNGEEKDKGRWRQKQRLAKKISCSWLDRGVDTASSSAAAASWRYPCSSLKFTIRFRKAQKHLQYNHSAVYNSSLGKWLWYNPNSDLVRHTWCKSLLGQLQNWLHLSGTFCPSVIWIGLGVYFLFHGHIKGTDLKPDKLSTIFLIAIVTKCAYLNNKAQETVPCAEYSHR